MNVNSEQEETAGLVFPREGEGEGKRWVAGDPKRWPAQQSACAVSAGEYYTWTEHSAPWEEAVLSATFSRPIPIYFSDELPVQGLVALGFFAYGFGVRGFFWLFGFFFFFLNIYFNLPAFQSRIARWEKQIYRSGHPQGVWGFKSQEKKPSPQRKIRNKNAFLRRSTAFKEIPPAFPLCSALPLARAGVEVVWSRSMT